jgi:CheY-like chemotaxis protein
VRAQAYDAVLMDCQMPDVDGFQATTMIRALEGPKARIPIIALTAHAMVDDRARVLRGGMDDYATKPIRGRVLSSLLLRWLPRNHSQSPGPARAPEPQPTAAGAPPEQAVAASEAESSGSDEVQLDPTLPRSRKVVELFLQTVPEVVAALATAVQVKDHPKVRQLAHKLKGNCLSLGANRMAAACHTVELAASAGSIDLAAHGCVAPELAAVIPLLTQVLEKQANNDTQTASA